MHKDLGNAEQSATSSAHLAVNKCLPKTVGPFILHADECRAFVRTVVARKIVEQSRGKRRHVAAVAAKVNRGVDRAQWRGEVDGTSNYGAVCLVCSKYLLRPLATRYGGIHQQGDDSAPRRIDACLPKRGHFRLSRE